MISTSSIWFLGWEYLEGGNVSECEEIEETMFLELPIFGFFELLS